jgi:Holin of 3TMs, for gene-transfer release
MAFDPLSAAFELGGKVLDHFFPDPEKRAAAQLELLKLQQSGDLAKMANETSLMQQQTDVNKAEAANANMFVAGWRPAVGWCCGLGLFSQFIVQPFATWIAALLGKPIAYPSLDMGTLMTLLLGMLGLGAARTYEKVQGVEGSESVH